MLWNVFISLWTYNENQYKNNSGNTINVTLGGRHATIFEDTLKWNLCDATGPNVAAITSTTAKRYQSKIWWCNFSVKMFGLVFALFVTFSRLFVVCFYRWFVSQLIKFNKDLCQYRHTRGSWTHSIIQVYILIISIFIVF
jgi:hypothetical protein